MRFTRACCGAAEHARIELIVVDNCYQAKVALRNAQQLIREKVDLAIEFQTDEAAAPAIASKYLEAGIPLIAIDIPHPGATYFGANNYQAGLLAGRYLGRWARSQWAGRVDEILLLELARAGSLVHARMSGALAGLKESLPEAMEACRVVTLDGDGQFKVSVERVRKHLRESKAHHVLVGGSQRSERPRSGTGVSGERPRGYVCDRRAERRARRPGGAARGANAPHRVGRLFPREVRRRRDQARRESAGAEARCHRLSSCVTDHDSGEHRITCTEQSVVPASRQRS